jgi:hypothetical protein
LSIDDRGWEAFVPITVLLWKDLPAPKEEEPPKIGIQKALFDTERDFNDDEEEAVGDEEDAVDE